jgi:hypothetical protein
MALHNHTGIKIYVAGGAAVVGADIKGISVNAGTWRE